MRWQRGVALSWRLSGQNPRAVQLQMRYIRKLLPRGLKTWLRSFFFFSKVFFSTPFRNISCPQWKTPQNINNYEKTESCVSVTSSTRKKTEKCVLFKWLLRMSLGVVCSCCLVNELCPTLCNRKDRQAPLSLELSKQEF